MKIKHLHIFLSIIILISVCTHFPKNEINLEKGFKTPPNSAKPYVWRHWMDGNVTKTGITADLEAMKKVGMGGAQIFDITGGRPEGPVTFGSTEWFEMLRYASSEARRLGLELGIHNCLGWTSSGGPWITPEQSMKTIVTSEMKIHGSTKINQELLQPPAKYNFYRDIAILAFNTPASEDINTNELVSKITLNNHQNKFELSYVGKSKKHVQINNTESGQYIQFEFKYPISVRTITITSGNKDWIDAADGRIEASDNGKGFHTIKGSSMLRSLDVNVIRMITIAMGSNLDSLLKIELEMNMS